MSSETLLDNIQKLLKEKYNADVDRSSGFLEADLPKSLPKEESADGKYAVLLTVRVMIDGEGRLISDPHISEEELKDPTQLKGGRDRTKDYHKHEAVAKLTQRLQEDIEKLKSGGR